MRIGMLAKNAGVNAQTVRFYERQGLLPLPARLASGYREYAAADVHRIEFIRSCQAIGFMLKDVKEVLELHRVLAAPERAARIKPRAQKRLLATAHRRLATIEDKIKILTQMKQGMSVLVTTLSGGEKPVCPVSGARIT